MLWPRLLALPLLAGLVLFAAGALMPQREEADAPTCPAPRFPARDEPAARQAVREALAALAPERTPWIKTELWQQASAGPLAFQARGLYLGGPDHRLRLDLQVQQGNARSRQLTVCDGRTIWQAQQLVGQERVVTRIDLDRVWKHLNRPGNSAEARREFFEAHCHVFLGLAPLLGTVHDTMTFTRRQLARWRDRDIILLNGVWAQPPEEWPASFPRQCRVFLDARTRWPHRLEWWGPLPKRSGDSLLLQMEFRNPAIGQPLPEAEFTFQPGNSKVTDLTDDWVKR